MTKLKEKKIKEWFECNIEYTNKPTHSISTADLNKDFCATYNYEYNRHKNNGFGQLFNKIIKKLKLNIYREVRHGDRSWVGIRFRSNLSVEEKIKALKNVEYEISDKFFDDVKTLLNNQSRMVDFLYDNFKKGKKI